MSFSSPIGLVAGSGSLPIECVRSAALQGVEVVVCAHVGEASKELAELCKHCEWVKVGELGKIIDTFKRYAVHQVCFAGGISRVKIFGGVKLDLRGLALMARLRSVKDDAILRGVAEELEREGMTVFSPSILAKVDNLTPGPLTRRALSEQEAKDAKIGWEAALSLGELDIGQTVVVKDGVVVAVEGIEGTDRCILRAGELCGPGAVVVKVCKPQQDIRLDLPTIGPKTVDSMRKAGAKALVLEAKRSILLEQDETIRSADKEGIAIVLVEDLSAI